MSVIKAFMQGLFVWVYMPALMIGLVNYDFNSDFDSPSATVYLLLLLLIPLGLWKKTWGMVGLRGLLLMLGLLALWSYAPLHMHFWDERNLQQAWSWIGVGFLSFALATHFDATTQRPQASASLMVVLALMALISTSWVFVALVLIGLVCFGLLISPVSTLGSEPLRAQQPSFSGYEQVAVIIASSVFLLAVFDAHVQPSGMIYLFWGFVGVAAGIALARAFLGPVFAGVGVINFILIALLPIYVIEPLAMVLNGIWLGVLWNRKQLTGISQARWALLSFVGFFIAVLFSKNLLYWSGLLILLIPLLLAVLSALYARKSSKSLIS